MRSCCAVKIDSVSSHGLRSSSWICYGEVIDGYCQDHLLRLHLLDIYIVVPLCTAGELMPDLLRAPPVLADHSVCRAAVGYPEKLVRLCGL
eukprot:IDg14701t1